MVEAPRSSAYGITGAASVLPCIGLPCILQFEQEGKLRVGRTSFWTLYSGAVWLILLPEVHFYSTIRILHLWCNVHPPTPHVNGNSVGLT